MHAIRTIAIAALAAAGIASAADAAIYNFSYQGSTVLIAGQLEGTLQPDNNTVIVSAILGTPTVNGSPALPLSFIESISEFFFGVPAADPTVSLDGSVTDFLACTSSFCFDGFLLSTLPGFNGFQSGPAFGSAVEPYSADNWSLSLVPEPATWGMLVAGFGILGLAARRRRAATA